MERNRKAGQNPPKIVAPIEEEKEDALITQIYFWNKTLHVSDSSSVHHQEFFTVHGLSLLESYLQTEELSETCSFIPKINLGN
jgi:hypothetical protein